MFLRGCDDLIPRLQRDSIDNPLQTLGGIAGQCDLGGIRTDQPGYARADRPVNLPDQVQLSLIGVGSNPAINILFLPSLKISLTSKKFEIFCFLVV